MTVDQDNTGSPCISQWMHLHFSVLVEIVSIWDLASRSPLSTSQSAITMSASVTVSRRKLIRSQSRVLHTRLVFRTCFRVWTLPRSQHTMSVYLAVLLPWQAKFDITRSSSLQATTCQGRRIVRHSCCTSVRDPYRHPEMRAVSLWPV
jgi:hypothetical protein